jgi:hypothetical protein
MTNVTNDRRTFYAVSIDSLTGEAKLLDRRGTIEAIHRDGLKIDPISEAWCPHQWLDESGYYDPQLARKHPLSALAALTD